MYRISLILSILIVFSTYSIAQNATEVYGSVKDPAGKGISGATVTLLKCADSSLVAADITDDNGQFDVTIIESVRLFVMYSMVGYVSKTSEPIPVITGTRNHAPDVSLSSTSAQLKTVDVVARKPLIEVKADKIVFNVESSINATGSNAMELLRKSPGVQVDNNENISMRGKTGVKIYIDGKMSQLSAQDLAIYLKSINSNDIEAIEMISNPGAKYEASGNAGIINIRLKKNKKFGTNGSVSMTGVESIYEKNFGSVNLNYRDKKINVFGNVSGYSGKDQNTLNLNRTQMDTSYIQRTSHVDNAHNVNLKAGVDYFMNAKSTLGFLLTTNVRDNKMNSISNTQIYDNQGDYLKRLLAYNTIPGSRTNNNINLNYKYADTNGRSLNIDADYGLFRGRGSSLQPNYYLKPNDSPLDSVINSNYTPTNIDIYTLKADWEQNLGKGKLGLGGKIAYVKTDNTFNFYNVVNAVPEEAFDLSNNFRYTENVNAAYVNYNVAFAKKLSLQAGLRLENTISMGTLTRADGTKQADDSVKRNYTDLFPSAALSYNLNDKNSFNLTYSRRIDRPGYQDLNPFENKLDALTYEKGNAFLQPQYSDVAELTHTFMGILNSTLDYTYVHDYATQVTDTQGNASYVQQRNLANVQLISLTMSAPIPITKWWNAYINGSYVYQMFDGVIGKNPVHATIPSYNFYMQQTFILGKDYTLEVSGDYSGPSVWGVTWYTLPNGGMDLGIQKLFWSKRASLKLALTDIFYTRPWSAHSNFGGLNVNGNGSFESQSARLSFTYRFGSNEVSKARERTTGMESEGNRIKGK